MASLIPGIVLLVVGAIGVNRLICLNEASTEKNVIRNRDVPNFVIDSNTELFNPMNTGTRFDKLNPIDQIDEGPFGIPRQSRKSNADTTYYTYGNVLEEY